MRTFSKQTVVVTAAAVVLAGSGVAFAFWTAGGTGTGTAVTGTSAAVTVNQTSTLTPMYPGDSAQPLSGNFDNTGTGPIHVSNVTVSIASVTSDGQPVDGCSVADYSLTGAMMAAPQNVAVGAAVGAWSGATIQFNNTDADQDACQGATVNLAYVAS